MQRHVDPNINWQPCLGRELWWPTTVILRVFVMTTPEFCAVILGPIWRTDHTERMKWTNASTSRRPSLSDTICNHQNHISSKFPVLLDDQKRSTTKHPNTCHIHILGQLLNIVFLRNRLASALSTAPPGHGGGGAGADPGVLCWMGQGRQTGKLGNVSVNSRSIDEYIGRETKKCQLKRYHWYNNPFQFWQHFGRISR